MDACVPPVKTLRDQNCSALLTENPLRGTSILKLSARFERAIWLPLIRGRRLAGLIDVHFDAKDIVFDFGGLASHLFC
jgi:hypothetical protein